MTFDYEASIVREFNTFVKKGYVQKRNKPVHWCPSCITALAEAEVEYSDKESPSIFVKFGLDEENIRTYFPGLAGKKVAVVIWTTTPWTLPANLAIAFHPDLEYAAVEKDGEVLVVAEAGGGPEGEDRTCRRGPCSEDGKRPRRDRGGASVH